jgi:signal transduction histidine kinase
VVLILSPFLLILSILLGIIAAFLYLKREEEHLQKKTDFMRAAHHELKTPIAAISGIIDGMIDNVGVYKNRDEYLPKAKESVERLNLLINDVLNATQAMDHKVQKEAEDIGELLNEVIERYESLLLGKNWTFEKFRYTKKTNKVLLKTAFSNLISNAVKYTTGEIKIKFEGGVLSIENECEPIDEDSLQKIFEPFYTLSQSRSRSQSGNGIGLYIVKRNLEALKLKYIMRNTEKGVVFEIFF